MLRYSKCCMFFSVAANLDPAELKKLRSKQRKAAKKAEQNKAEEKKKEEKKAEHQKSKSGGNTVGSCAEEGVCVLLMCCVVVWSSRCASVSNMCIIVPQKQSYCRAVNMDCMQITE